MSEPVDQKTLETFVSQRYHWKTLLPSHQMSMATEILKHRFIQEKMFRFLSEVIDDKDALRKYRELIEEYKL